MKRILLKVNYWAVLDEVAKTTAYTAAKMDGDATATARVATVREDEELLLRYWHEAEDALLGALKRQLVAYEEKADGTLELTLETGSLFNTALTGGMNSSLHSYFTSAIISKWFSLVNRNEAAAYTEATASYLKEMVVRILDRSRPERPSYPPLAPADELERERRERDRLERRKRKRRHHDADTDTDTDGADTDDTVDTDDTDDTADQAGTDDTVTGTDGDWQDWDDDDDDDSDGED